jgi:hypothetical protein
MKPKPNLLLSSGAYRPMGKFRQMAANAEISPAEVTAAKSLSPHLTRYRMIRVDICASRCPSGGRRSRFSGLGTQILGGPVA